MILKLSPRRQVVQCAYSPVVDQFSLPSLEVPCVQFQHSVLGESCEATAEIILWLLDLILAILLVFLIVPFAQQGF